MEDDSWEEALAADKSPCEDRCKALAVHLAPRRAVVRSALEPRNIRVATLSASKQPRSAAAVAVPSRNISNPVCGHQGWLEPVCGRPRVGYNRSVDTKGWLGQRLRSVGDNSVHVLVSGQSKCCLKERLFGSREQGVCLGFHEEWNRVHESNPIRARQSQITVIFTRCCRRGDAILLRNLSKATCQFSR